MTRIIITVIISGVLSCYTASLVSGALSAVPPILFEAGTEVETGIW